MELITKFNSFTQKDFLNRTNTNLGFTELALFEELIYNPKSVRKDLLELETKKFEFKPTTLKIGNNRLTFPLLPIFTGKIHNAIESMQKIFVSSCMIYLKTPEKGVVKYLDRNPKNLFGIENVKLSFKTGTKLSEVFSIKKDPNSTVDSLQASSKNIDVTEFLKNTSQIILDLTCPKTDLITSASTGKYTFIIEIGFSTENGVSKNIKGDSPEYSNKLFYWNSLGKKFKSGTLTEQEKEDYKNLCQARSWWIMMDLNDSEISPKLKTEYKKRFQDFEDKIERAMMKIPDDYFKVKYRRGNHLNTPRQKITTKYISTDDIRKIKRVNPTKDLKWSAKKAYESRKYVEPTKPNELKKVIDEYNDWLESIDIPWNEISKYLNVTRKISQSSDTDSPSYVSGEIPKMVGGVLKKVGQVIDYAFDMSDPETFKMSKSEYELAKSDYGKVLDDVLNRINQIEPYLSGEYQSKSAKSYVKMLQDKIEEIKKTIKKGDKDSVIRLKNELEKIYTESDLIHQVPLPKDPIEREIQKLHKEGDALSRKQKKTPEEIKRLEEIDIEIQSLLKKLPKTESEKRDEEIIKKYGSKIKYTEKAFEEQKIEIIKDLIKNFKKEAKVFTIFNNEKDLDFTRISYNEKVSQQLLKIQYFVEIFEKIVKDFKNQKETPNEYLWVWEAIDTFKETFKNESETPEFLKWIWEKDLHADVNFSQIKSSLQDPALRIDILTRRFKFIEKIWLARSSYGSKEKTPNWAPDLSERPLYFFGNASDFARVGNLIIPGNAYISTKLGDSDYMRVGNKPIKEREFEMDCFAHPQDPICSRKKLGLTEGTHYEKVVDPNSPVKAKVIRFSKNLIWDKRLDDLVSQMEGSRKKPEIKFMPNSTQSKYPDLYKFAKEKRKEYKAKDDTPTEFKFVWDKIYDKKKEILDFNQFLIESNHKFIKKPKAAVPKK